MKSVKISGSLLSTCVFVDLLDKADKRAYHFFPLGM